MDYTEESAVSALQGDAGLCADELYLALGDCTLRLRSNSTAVLADLGDYFSHVACAAKTPDIDIIAIERDAPELGVDFIDWKREPGKTGRKDSYVDLTDGRIVRKVRTGMVFLQSEQYCIAAGPCLQYDNQVINFINSQYMKWLQNRGWLICHAAGLVYRGWLMTRLIPNVVPLADLLEERAADVLLWRRTGRAIRRFHDEGVVHADLNARNILLGPEDAIHLVDFDRARFTPGNGRAFAANLSRLRRSLEKLWPAPRRDRLEDCWRELVAGYRDRAETP